jgi:hypothetical protein
MKRTRKQHAAGMPAQLFTGLKTSFSICLVFLLPLLLLTTPLSAQTFLNDHMSTHDLTTSPNDIMNHAIKQDAANNKYYIVQSQVSVGYTLTISEVDDEFNILATYRYVCVRQDGSVNTNMYITPKDIDFYNNEIIVVGRYIEEGLDDGAFMFSANKSTGSFQWFKKYLDIHTLQSVVCNSKINGAMAVGFKYYDPNISFARERGIVARMDNSGGVVWTKEIDDSKYVGTGIPNTYADMQDVIQIESNQGQTPDKYAAVGNVNAYTDWTFGEADGDGALVVFDDNGNFSTQLGLGNILPITYTPGPQNMRCDVASSVTLCSDGDVVIGGAVIERADNYIHSLCMQSTPTIAGLWVTKINPYTGATDWSYLYDYKMGNYTATDYPAPGYLKIINDGSDNFGISYRQDFSTIMKVDVNGGLVYSRGYYPPWTNGHFFDIAPGIGSTDILATGRLTTYIAWNGAWNVVAYDNIQDYCESEERELDIYEHEYEEFNIDVLNFNAMPTDVRFVDGTIEIVRNVNCEKVEVEEEGGEGKNAIDNGIVVTVNHDIVTGDVTVQLPARATYSGKLLNNLGQVISSYNNLHNRYTINTSGLASGMYFLHLDNGKERTVKPVVAR